MDSRRIARLTDRQRYCLRLVHARMSSSQIAPLLRVEPGTVDQYVRAAARTLCVRDPRTAARILAEREPGIAPPAPPAADPGDAGTTQEIFSAIRHGFGNLLNFSGRDTRRQFWPYAILMLALHGGVVFAILGAQSMRFYLWTTRYMAAHPQADPAEISMTVRNRIDLTTSPGFHASVLYLAAAAYVVLIAAALARRRHDRDAVEAAGVLALPLLAVVLASNPMLVPAAFSLLSLCACFYAFIGGGAPERIVSGTIIAGMAITLVLLGVRLEGFQEAEAATGWLGAGAFFIYLFVALRANRFWPIWAVAFNGLEQAALLAKLLNPQLPSWTYLTAGSIWVYPLMLALIVGTRAHRIRLARDGVDPAWTPRRRAGT